MYYIYQKNKNKQYLIIWLCFSYGLLVLVLYICNRVECGIFFQMGQNRSSNQSSGMILDACQSFNFQKIPRGPNIKKIVKIGMKLPFTVKNKRRNTNLKLDF